MRSPPRPTSGWFSIHNSLDLAKAITWMGQNGIDVFNASLGFIAAYPGNGTGTRRPTPTRRRRPASPGSTRQATTP